MRKRAESASDEHAPPDWMALQQYYELLARIPLTDAVQRAGVAADAAEMLRVLEFFSDEAPPELRALLERMARGDA